MLIELVQASAGLLIFQHAGHLPFRQANRQQSTTRYNEKPSIPTMTSLTCPHCGGKLARSHTAGILVCLYCGVEQYASEVPEAEEAGPRLQGAISVGLPNGMAVPLLARGARLPAEVLHSFSTTTDNQSKLSVTLVFGEHQRTQDNIALGTFAFDHITPAPRGVPTLEIRMSVDERRQLTVTATDVSASRTEVIGRVDLSGLTAPPSPGS